MYNLLDSMNTAIGTAGAGHFYGMLGDLCEGLLHSVLNAATARLCLPAAIVAAMIFKPKSDSHTTTRHNMTNVRQINAASHSPIGCAVTLAS